MAIDTPNKRRNVAGIELPWTVVDLVPGGTVNADDRENQSNAYIGFDYVPTSQAPDAEFGYDIDEQTITVDFFDQSLFNPTSWAWDFGDPGSGIANASTAQDPVHIFTGFGTFTVTLTATNPQGSDSVQHQITITDPGLPYIPINYHAAQGRALLIEQFRIRGE